MLRAAVHLRTTSLLVMDSCCRGGIVHSRFGCSCARIERPESPKALWRFRASTSNSQVAVLGCIRTRIFVKFIILTLNKIFEYVEMTIVSRPKAVRIPRRFDFFA